MLLLSKGITPSGVQKQSGGASATTLELRLPSQMVPRAQALAGEASWAALWAPRPVVYPDGLSSWARSLGFVILPPPYKDFSGISDGKESACNSGDLNLIPGSGRSPGEGNGNPLCYSYLGNPIDRGDWCATVHGVAKSRTQLRDFHFTFLLTKPWGVHMDFYPIS